MKARNLEVLGFLSVLSVATLFTLALGDDPISPTEKDALNKFLPMVQDVLTDDYMKSDAYLIHWIRAKNMNLPAAKEMVLKNVQWKKDHSISIHKTQLDKTSAIAKEFPIHFPGVDKKGRPYYIQDWSGNLAKVGSAREDWHKHTGSAFELAERKILQLNKHNNNTEWIAIYDFDNFGIFTHLCLSCLTAYSDHASCYMENYPLRAREVYVINAPGVFDVVLRLVKPILGKTMERITVFGTDKDEWKAALLEVIPADQLPTEYGGTLNLIE